MLDDLGKMLESCRRVRSTDDLNIVVGPDSAIVLLKEAFASKSRRITFTDEVDELFIYDGVPVVLRISATPGVASLVKDLPQRSCCDKTAMTVMAIAICEARA